MAGHGGPDGQFGGFGVADLAHHEHVRVVAQQRFERFRKTHVLGDFHGGHPFQLVFHRVFDGIERFFREVVADVAQQGFQSGGFAAAGGAGHDHQAVSTPGQAAHNADLLIREPQLVDTGQVALIVQDSQGQLGARGGDDFNGRHFQAQTHLPVRGLEHHVAGTGFQVVVLFTHPIHQVVGHQLVTLGGNRL